MQIQLRLRLKNFLNFNDKFAKNRIKPYFMIFIVLH